MGFGQYSTQGVPRKSKGDMLAEIAANGDNRVALPAIISSKMIARNTLEIQTADGSRVVRLHGTNVFRQCADGTIMLDTGGWNTKTTRDRLDMALKGTGFAVFTSRGVLSVFQPLAGPYSGPKPGTKAAAFNQRVTIRPGNPPKIESDIAGETLGYDALRKHVDRYIAKLKRDGIPTDSGGDPWILPIPSDGRRKPDLHSPHLDGKYRAEHVREWIGATEESPEPYVFLSFIVAALRFCGRTDMGISMDLREFNKRPSGYHRRHVCRSVRRYIRACLGFATS